MSSDWEDPLRAENLRRGSLGGFGNQGNKGKYPREHRDNLNVDIDVGRKW